MPLDSAAATARPPITAIAHGDGSSPDTVTLTVGDATHTVDVSCDRDDWELPDLDAADAHLALWAIDEAIERWHLARDRWEVVRTVTARRAA